jgi:serine/threonine protein kinase
MAPEVIMSEPYTYSADIYSLGVITYYLATGSYPHIFTAFDDLLTIL